MTARDKRSKGKNALMSPRPPQEAGVAARSGVPSPGFSELDRHFARFIGRLAGEDRVELRLAATLVSQQREAGNICLDLASVAGDEITDPSDGRPVGLPPLEVWETALLTSAVVGRPGEFKPLILDAAHRLYLHRY